MKASLIALLLVALTVPARASGPFSTARMTTLPNGLHVLLAPDSTAVSVGLGVWVRAGSRDERPGATGVTHAIERLMFMGTTKTPRGAYATRVQGEGGTFSAFTAADHTCFESVFPAGALESVLRLEADRFADATVTPERLELARRTLREERRGRADQTAVGRAVRLLYATAYAGHPYRTPVAGLDEDVDRLTAREIVAYRAAHYVPRHMLVTLAGRFDPAQALAAVRRTLGALPAGAAVADPPVAAPASGERRAHGVAPSPATVLAMAWRTPAATDPDEPALEILARVLTTGPGARIQTALVRGESAPCGFAQGGFDGRARSGLLYVLASPAPSADSARVEAAVIDAVEGLARVPLGAEDLDAARRQFESELVGALQTPAGMGRALGLSWLTLGDADGLAKRLERVRTVTAADVQRAAARVLVAANRTEVWVSPGSPKTEDRP